MSKFVRWALTILLTALLVGAAGFVLWAENASAPAQPALDALKSDNMVAVSLMPQYIKFSPAQGQPDTAFIFYPGGRVDYRAYAPPLRMIAAQGYLVFLVPVRLNLAFLDLNAGDAPLQDFPAIQHWAIGGHSLGGVAASVFAASHPRIQGLVFWASYPGDNRLKNSSLQIMSIYATLDGLATPQKIDASRALLPAGTLFVPIAGGDHAGFGAYGPQPGDNPASIPATAQWQQTADATVRLLKLLGP